MRWSKDRALNKYACFLLSALVAALGCGLLSIARADESDVIGAFRAYRAALEAGSYSDASRAGERAWRLAEDEYGPEKQTAILAYNLAILRLSKEPAEALLPAKRAFELAEQGLVDNSYTIDDARLLYLLANYAATDFARRAERKLAEQLRTRDDSKLPDTSVSANAWFYLSGEALKREDFSRALISARRTQRAIQSVAKGDQINFARALVFEGISLLNIRNRETKDIVKALDIFLRASKLFASYLEGDEMSSEAFRVEAWRFAADALLASESKARHRRYWDDSETPNAILSAYPREKFFPYNVNCPTDWLNKEAPVYPNEALQEGYVGAAIVSYNFGETGAAENIRIEAEVPKELFSKSIVAAVRKWRIANMVELDKRCQMKRYVGFSFGVGRRAR